MLDQKKRNKTNEHEVTQDPRTHANLKFENISPDIPCEIIAFNYPLYIYPLSFTIECNYFLYSFFFFSALHQSGWNENCNIFNLFVCRYAVNLCPITLWLILSCLCSGSLKILMLDSNADFNALASLLRTSLYLLFLFQNFKNIGRAQQIIQIIF